MGRKFFLTWLKLGCLITGMTGLVAFAASVQAYSGPWLWLFDWVRWPLDNHPASFSAEAQSLSAILGGVMVGWAMLMYFATVGPIAEGNTTFARQMLVSVLAWFCVDSIGSYLSHLPGNILLNLVFLIILAAPLVALSQEPQPISSASKH